MTRGPEDGAQEIRVASAGGEYMDSVVVVEWHKAVGDAVAAGDLLVTVETAKAATEIAADCAGILASVLAPVGAEIAVGGLLGLVTADGALPGERPPASPFSLASGPAPRPVSDPVPPHRTGGRIPVSPFARRIAAEAGIDPSILAPSSPSGRIKARDIRAAAAARPRLAMVETRDLRIARRSGRGAPILFIHGFGAEGASWRPLVSALRLGRPVLLPDLPGHGRSPIGSSRSIRDLAALIAATLEQTGETEFHVVGHSLGGAVAMALCETGGLDIRSLCLLAPAGLGPEIDGAFLHGYATAGDIPALTPWLVRIVGDPSFVTPAFAGRTMAARSDPALRSGQADLARRIFPDGRQTELLAGALDHLHAPQRVIWGMEDRILPPFHSEALGPRVARHLLPGIGHLPHLEAVDLVADLMSQTILSAG